jgi:hypothetical protein
VLPGTVVGDAEMVEQEAMARSFLDAWGRLQMLAHQRDMLLAD